jgi:hypothetical protein
MWFVEPKTLLLVCTVGTMNNSLEGVMGSIIQSGLSEGHSFHNFGCYSCLATALLWALPGSYRQNVYHTTHDHLCRRCASRDSLLLPSFPQKSLDSSTIHAEIWSPIWPQVLGIFSWLWIPGKHLQLLAWVSSLLGFGLKPFHNNTRNFLFWLVINLLKDSCNNL